MPNHEQIVFDILDELTDEKPFADWWWGLSIPAQDTLREKLEQLTLDNLKPNIPPRRLIRGMGKN